MEVMSCGLDGKSLREVFFSEDGTMKLVRVGIREASGAAFIPSILKHNIIINSSSSIPSLCHTDE